ncbi:hypothetical protein FACS1894211_15440 [Clostridia bacterium]|nr:hypothetical protein FACS1894211_15440 [Clostridia bacterium]
MNLFVERLKKLIQETGKSQVQICKELNIKKQALTNWKTGYSEPNIDDILMLANYSNVTTDYLLGRENI